MKILLVLIIYWKHIKNLSEEKETKKETKEQNVIAGWPFVAKPVKIKELIDRINEYVR